MKYNYDNLTGNEVFFEGDIIKNRPTSYPHLDMVGDIGSVNSKDNKKIAKYVAIKINKDTETNEAITMDIQLVQSFDSSKCLQNPNAKCAIHGLSFPCEKCKELEKQNYL